MTPSKKTILARLFMREEIGVRPAEDEQRVVEHVSKSELRALFSDVFEDQTLTKNGRIVTQVDEAA